MDESRKESRKEVPSPDVWWGAVWQTVLTSLFPGCPTQSLERLSFELGLASS